MNVGSKEEEATETIDDRVFVCMGKSQDGLNTVNVWVMALNRTFDTVTFYEVKNHADYTLRGRIKAGEEKYLEGYLSPKLSVQEKEEIESLR